MRYLKLAYLFVGIVLLLVVLSSVPLSDVWFHARQIGWGIVVVLGLFMIAFVLDAYSWQLTLITLPMNVTWLYRLWKVRMAGEVFNMVLPAASMGGEPLKAMLLKAHYAVDYHESIASLVLARTINLIGLILFLIVGFGFMLSAVQMPMSFKLIAGMGLLALIVATGLFFCVQRWRLFSVAGTRISQWKMGKRLEQVLEHVRAVDERFVRFYSLHRGRLAGAIGLALFNWIMGIFEIYYTMIFLGHPISLTEAWMIEAVAQMVRAGTFLIPASIGAQEGAFMLVYTVITGSPALGIAVAMTRRFREVLWLVWGASVGLRFSLSAKASTVTGPQTPHR